MGITIVGLGPGNGRYLTREAWDILTNASNILLRTARHPTVADLPDSVTTHSFDHIYDTTDRFEEVYATIVNTIIEQAAAGDMVYAVPGHPLMGESTVTALLAKAKEENIPVRIVDGISFVEPMITAVSLDALDGLQIFDAIDIANRQYPPLDPDTPALIGQVYSKLLASELKLVLMMAYPEEHPVKLVHAAGTKQEIIEAMPLYEMDRSPHIDHLTSMFVPPLPHPSSLNALADTVAVLRSPGGCPWDQEQTPQSMRQGFLEEFGEVLAALDADDTDNLREELGDLLYHIVMQTQMATEAGDFRLPDIIAEIDAKLKHRHPHVWGDVEVADSDEVVRNWERIKAKEKGGLAEKSLLDNIPTALPALAQSQKVQDKVRKVGFDWPAIEGVYEKLQEEIAEIQAAQSQAERQAEVGDALFVLVNLASWLGVDAESALREATLRFRRRFQLVEQLAAQNGGDLAKMSLDEMETLWQQAKKIVADDEMIDKVDGL
ncbi:MAG: nucleoside triphosphate pyrophosphohydrolase [Candidatus Promineifilaceae bacterium]